jgi:hypothetical protein
LPTYRSKLIDNKSSFESTKEFDHKLLARKNINKNKEIIKKFYENQVSNKLFILEYSSNFWSLYDIRRIKNERRERKQKEMD